MNSKTLLSLFSILIVFSSISQNTYVPDNNFENYFITEGYDTGPQDDSVPTLVLNKITSIDISWQNISDLTGIEDCIALTHLDCGVTNISILDLSNNVALKYLSCYGNSLSTLNLKNNTNLISLGCSGNSFTQLDLTSNQKLNSVDCSFNNLSSLQISSPRLDFLSCDRNQLSSLDLSSCIRLTSFNCSQNKLTSLDLKQNTLLESILCINNQLNGLDLRLHTQLIQLQAATNNFNFLKISNGNNQNMINANFSVINNPNLECIEVDSKSWSSIYWRNIDQQSYFSHSCSYASISKTNSGIIYNIDYSDFLIKIESEIDFEFVIYNSNGQNLKSGQLGTGYHQISCDFLASGTYFIALNFSNQKVTEKFTVYH